MSPEEWQKGIENRLAALEKDSTERVDPKDREIDELIRSVMRSMLALGQLLSWIGRAAKIAAPILAAIIMVRFAGEAILEWMKDVFNNLAGR